MFIKLKDPYPFIVFCFLCIIFICIKIPNLNIPYYWDEAWVYVPGIKAMAHTGISLFPGSLKDAYSRGHPLLFFCTGSLWLKLFGDSFISLHLFALVIAIVFLFTLYYITRKLFDSTMALVVTSITVAQPNFFAQSAITLPEVFLSLWAILTIYHFVVKNYYYYFLFGSLLVLTKESGVAIIGALLIYRLICFLTQKITRDSFYSFLRDSLVTFIPLLIFILFLIVQRYQRGYYFFQNHIDLLSPYWGVLQERFRHCYYNLFIQQGRASITWSFLILFGLFYKQIPATIRLIIIAGLIVSVKIFFRNWAVPAWITLSFIGVCISIYYYWVHIKYVTNSAKTERLLAVLFITIVVFIVFSSINFLLSRYLLIMIPFIILYLTYYVRASFQFRTPFSYTWAAFIMCFVISNAIIYNTNTGDDSPGYIDAVKLQQMMVSYMEQQNMQKDTIYCQKTAIRIAFIDKNSGYLSGNTVFSNFSDRLDSNSKYVLYLNMDFEPPFYFTETDTLPPFQVVKKFDYGVAHGKLFKRIL